MDERKLKQLTDALEKAAKLADGLGIGYVAIGTRSYIDALLPVADAADAPNDDAPTEADGGD